MTQAEREYGGAMYALAEEEHCEDELLEGMTLADSVLRENPGYLTLVQNPAVPKDERLALLDEAFAGVHPYVMNFLKILCEKSALGITQGCLQEFKSQLYAARGILPVQAVSAVELSEEQRRALCDRLAAKTGRKILLEETVDPSVLGGVRLRYEGIELDGTAAGRLAALRRTLTQE